MDSVPPSIVDFLYVVEKLFGPKGCPWVRELDLSALELTLEEEVHEVLFSCREGDWDGLSDELGDLLFNVLCIAKVMDKKKHMVWTDPFAKAADKYRRRSPHVFIPGRELKTSKEVEIQWLRIKEQEQKNKGKNEKNVERSLRELPTLSAFAKVIERFKHDQEATMRLETLLNEPSNSEEEEIAKEFMRVAQRAYRSNVSLEIAGKQFLEKVIDQVG